MRQQLPESAGYPLNGPGFRIYPGVPFDYPELVAGCVDLDAPGPAGDESGTEGGTPEDSGSPAAGDQANTPKGRRRAATDSEGNDQ